MRYLILLRGSPATGKSTFLKTHNLSQYAISPDDLRVFVQPPVMTLEGNRVISQKNDHKVWNLLFDLLEMRMNNGELTIIDATHSRSALINRYKSLCQKYRYRCIVVNFHTPGMKLETALKYNLKREAYKFVPENVIENAFSRIATQKTPNWTTEMTPPEFLSWVNEFPIYDFNQYKKIIVFGDIHGCYEPLKEYFIKNPIDPGNFYIFVGDYFDRGIQNVEVFRLLFSILKHHKNILFLEGNHEIHMWNFGNSEEIKSKEFILFTQPELMNAGIDRSDIRQFYRKLAQVAYFEFDNKVYFINHAGYPTLPDWFTSNYELIKGVGKYEDHVKIADSWNNSTPENYYQIHGHRNVENVPIENGRVMNLCDTIEFGGNLRIVEIEKEA